MRIAVLYPIGSPYIERFRLLLTATWKRLPMHVRNHLLTYWRESTAGILAELTIDNVTYIAGLGETEYLGLCSCEGRRIAFWAEYVGIADSEHVQSTIAEELAHCYQWATGDASGYWDDWRKTGEFNPHLPMEEQAKAMVLDWGFDPYCDSEHEGLLPIHLLHSG